MEGKRKGRGRLLVLRSHWGCSPCVRPLCKAKSSVGGGRECYSVNPSRKRVEEKLIMREGTKLSLRKNAGQRSGQYWEKSTGQEVKLTNEISFTATRAWRKGKR